jgi:hypothetical protein
MEQNVTTRCRLWEQDQTRHVSQRLIPVATNDSLRYHMGSVDSGLTMRVCHSLMCF